MVLIGGRVVLFDCIEFNEDFRWIDVVSEIAFTYIDLFDHHQPELADWFLNEWLSRSGDYDAMSVFRFYAVYRALVLAKVAAIRAGQDLGNISETREYIKLAERLTLPPKPRLIITHGLAGCGKTTASTRLLLDDANAVTLRLRSDVERKRLFGLAAAVKSNSPLDGGIYGLEAHLLTYRRLQDLAQALLDAGWSVIVDAAFLKHAERAAFRALATQAGAEFRILAPQSSPAQLRARITTRLENEHDASEATLEVLEQQMLWIEPLDTDESNCLL
jgi:predicted kinase